MADKKKNKKKKGTVTVMRYVKVVKKVTAKASNPNNETASSSSTNIGTFGGLTFHVSFKDDGRLDILTMTDVNQEVSANWIDHVIIGRKYPKSEFIGANNRTFTMTIRLDRSLGQDPHKQLHELNEFCETGKVDELHIGGYKIGEKWKVTSLSQAWDKIYHAGQLVRATLTMTLTSYE